MSLYSNTSIYNNTITSTPTRFLTGVQLIVDAREKYKIPSENWVYPVTSFGYHKDKYYAEIWEDGMDWNKNIWAIESINYGDPVARPLMVFDDSNDYYEFNSHDLNAVWESCLRYRRGSGLSPNNDYQQNEIMNFVHPIKPTEFKPKTLCMKKYYIQHASQKRIEFWLNFNFMPISDEMIKKLLKNLELDDHLGIEEV